MGLFLIILLILSIFISGIFVICYLFLPPKANGVEFMVVPVYVRSKNTSVNVCKKDKYFAVRWKKKWIWHYFYDLKETKRDTHLVLFHTGKEAYDYINKKYQKSNVKWIDE